VNQIRIC